MSGRFGLVVKFTLKPGHEDAFDKLVSDTLAGIKHREPGTLIYACHRVGDVPGERVFYELYQDREAFDAHGRQPHVRHFLAEREQHLEHAEVDFLTLSDGKGLPTGGS
ncbi:MAG: putative quinol monooxygenase [Pseudonocardiales bacterium]